MHYLLDTHALIWFLKADAELSDYARSVLRDTGNVRFVSAASFWEIAIKVALGKIQLDLPFSELNLLMKKVGFEWLPIEFEHTLKVSSLPLLHRDPFDRMLVAQALAEQLTIVTKDPWFSLYDVPVVW
jgi:PIN domain nuclease of toxin-antitoxin system